MARTSKSWVWLLLAVMLLPGFLMADVTGTILGVITDPSGAVVQGVQVKATNVDTNQSSETTSNETGQFRILALPSGPYKLEATSAGFQTFVVTGVALSVNEQRRVDIVLRVGTTQQEVSVSANALQVETTNTQLGEVIDEKKILGLPLNGRSYIDLFGLQTGVAPSGTRGEGPGTVSVNGQRENSNGFLVNGGDVSGAANFGRGPTQFGCGAGIRLITNAFDAEYGRFGGAIMNTITKSGTDAIHGSVFEFLRNDDLDARGFFDTDKGALKKNQYGYAVGGPAIKNRLFWFTDYQGDRTVNGGTASQVPVLSNAERQGDVGVQNLTGTVTGAYGRKCCRNVPVDRFRSMNHTPASSRREDSRECTRLPPREPSVYSDSERRRQHFASSAVSRRSVDHKVGQRVDFLHKMTGTWSGYYYFDDFSSLDPTEPAAFDGLRIRQPEPESVGYAQ